MSIEKLEEAKRNWEEKRANFECELSITASASQKFEMQKRIQECEKEINRINATLESLKKNIGLSIDQSTIQEETTAVQLSNLLVTQKMHILHLSDLHFGTPEQAKVWYNQLAGDLTNKKELNISSLDALILSGDIANKSTSDEYEASQLFINNLCKEFPLKPEQIIIVPGNHDLNRPKSEEAYTPMQRRKFDGQTITRNGKIEPDPNYSIDVGEYVEKQDEKKYKERFFYFSNFYEAIKGNPYPLEYEKQYIIDYFPDQKLLILGLNSAWQLDHHYTNRASINMNALSNALTEIRLSTNYNNCLKIAVWHHPLDSAGNDRITDQSFMKLLAVAGFRLFLHGHIHQAETSLYRYDMNQNGRKTRSNLCWNFWRTYKRTCVWLSLAI